MARLWATILKETGYANKGSVKGPSTYKVIADVQTANGVKNTDYIFPDIENQALNITDTNNSYPIVSYGSNGGTRISKTIGYSVAGNWSTKLYEEQAEFLLDLAIRKRDSTTNPTGDLPSFRVDHCHYDSDHEPGLIANSYNGLKIGQFGWSAGVASPYVQCAAQMIGSRVNEIPFTTTNGVPTPEYNKEHPCDAYPNNPYTFRDVSVYMDFTGQALFPNKTGKWDLSGLTNKKLTVLRSVSLNFANQLATTSHEEGVVDRIMRTVIRPSFSIVVDMMDPGPASTASPKSKIWQDLYRALRTGGGEFSLGVVLDNGHKQIIFDLGRRAVLMGRQTILPITEIFAVQISGDPQFDPAICGTFDWTIQDSATTPASANP